MQPKNKKILVFGSLMMDTIIVIPEHDVERMSLQNATVSYLLLEQGKKVDVEHISSHIGGGAANVAVAMARMGFKADVLAVTGQDQNAIKIVKHLTTEKVGTDNIKQSAKEKSGTSVLVSSHDHNAAIFTYRGANGMLSRKQISDVDFKQYDLVYIAPLSNQSADQFSYIVDCAHEANCKIASNPGIRQLRLKREQITVSLAKIETLMINKLEATSLVSWIYTQINVADLEKDAAKYSVKINKIKSTDIFLEDNGLRLSLNSFCLFMHQQGLSKILLTDGRKGAYLFDGLRFYYQKALPVRSKGSAGAGDAFNATFTALSALNWPVDKALNCAARNASSVVSYIDTQSGLLSWVKLNKKA
jgi:ribokinase